MNPQLRLGEVGKESRVRLSLLLFPKNSKKTPPKPKSSMVIGEPFTDELSDGFDPPVPSRDYDSGLVLKAAKKGGDRPWPGPLQGRCSPAANLQVVDTHRGVVTGIGSTQPQGRRLWALILQELPLEGSSTRPPTKGSGACRRGNRPWVGRLLEAHSTAIA
ncbi:hypothetical protein B296_00025423 [Ensete ventricosum]|uniref:Uncharacterized protein n=1 Tax=Ensete ventricosum TaxID=4639 RepID=A0A426YHQ3_ENSVE|nr:hypothetical protein B296_00025423 [Ensete ventricosum]